MSSTEDIEVTQTRARAAVTAHRRCSQSHNTTVMAAVVSAETRSHHFTERDLNLVDKALQRLDKLHELCTDPRLGLRSSPPFLPDLVSGTRTLLAQVWESHRGPSEESSQVPRGDEAKYLKIHVRNLLVKTRRALLLFEDGQERIFNEKSRDRRNLTKLTLLFSHMLWELKSMFPGGCFQGDTYKMEITEAQEFWRCSFSNRCIVHWSSFEEHLQSVHSFEDGMESAALKSTINLTCNDHISVFEFDIFTRLFQPWRSLIRNWNRLAVTHPGYMAFLTYDQVTARLENYRHRPGSYIFRLSCTRMGQWAIGHVKTDGTIVQTIPQDIPLHKALIQGSKEGCYLYPDGRDANCDLTNLCEPVKVKVTAEQYEQYCEMGSTFELCKICAERDKNTRIQPCGHLLCRPCLSIWQQKSAGHTCPYCRCSIKGTESILVEPYLPEEEEEDDEDHEDIEWVVQEMAFRKQQMSGLEHQVSVSPTSTPPLPPKAPRSPSPLCKRSASETTTPARHVCHAEQQYLKPPAPTNRKEET